jgi:hypothetical protein
MDNRRAAQLEAENIMLKNCNRQLNTILEAWYSAFGTNQLDHAIARLELAEKNASNFHEKSQTSN